MKSVRGSVGVFDPPSTLMRMSCSGNTMFLPLTFGSKCGCLQRGILAFLLRVFGIRRDIELSHTRHWSRSVPRTLERRAPFP